MLKEIFRAEQLPVLQNRVYKTVNEAKTCPLGDVILVQDFRTGLVCNAAFRPDLMQYDSAYQNEQAFSQSFQAHLDDVTKVIKKHFSGKNIIEIGCGKGYFLERLISLGFEVIGYDPAYEGSNPNVIKDYYSIKTSTRSDGFILRHVLEHIPKPHEFLSELREANARRGLIYIEVPCFEWIMLHRAWFDIFYEHVNYFRLEDFQRMFGRVLEAGHFFGGQYLYVVADLASLKNLAKVPYSTVQLPDDFTSSRERLAKHICSRSYKTKAVIWGAASKGVIFSINMQRANARIDCVVDINPAKQGHYLPVTGLRVHSPKQMMSQTALGSDVYVMNRNYLYEIKQMTKKLFNYITVEHE